METLRLVPRPGLWQQRTDTKPARKGQLENGWLWFWGRGEGEEVGVRGLSRQRGQHLGKKSTQLLCDPGQGFEFLNLGSM